MTHLTQPGFSADTVDMMYILNIFADTIQTKWLKICEGMAASYYHLLLNKSVFIIQCLNNYVYVLDLQNGLFLLACTSESISSLRFFHHLPYL